MKNKRGFYDVFMRACAKYPSNVAVRYYKNGEYHCYTYSELYGVCEYLSQQLQQMQCNKGIIGLVSKTNIIVPCVIAASHKCSTSFMFLDPTNDVVSIIEDMKFTVILSVMEDELREESLWKKPDKIISVFGMRICFYDHTSVASEGYKYSPEHSFIAMTSGSTGEPKKIQVPVQCIQPNIEDLTGLFHITPDDIIYFSTPLTFDPSMVEVLLAFMNGASLLIAPPSIEALFPSKNEHGITVWQTTPSKFFMFSNCHIKNTILSANSPLRILALGGEPMNGLKLLRDLKDPNNKTRIFTLYGVTEMSCWASVAELELNRSKNAREVPLGKCLSETKIIVEPENPNSKVNTGKIILVSKTRRCIVLNKGEDMNSLRFVDTGDLAEASNGTIYYRGRKDDVIKRFGHKVNLQFIESTIMHCPRIKACSCLWLPKPQLLVVYFTSESFTSQDLSDFIKCKLDDKHWPDRIIRVDNMPVTRHGKISKSMLSKLIGNMSSSPTLVYQMKLKFMQELRSALNVNFLYDEIKDKTFTGIGGSSFQAVSICNSISVSNPELGKFMLPHLLSERRCIYDIMEMAERDFCNADLKPKKRLRIQSVTESSSPSIPSLEPKIAPTPSGSAQPVEIIEMWTYDTGKCVDASPSLYKSELNLYVTVGSHSGKVITVDVMTGILVGTIEMKARVEAAVFCYTEPNLPACGIVGAYDGTVVCFKIETNEELWRTNVGAMVKSKVTVWNGLVYVASYDGVVRCLDLLDGKIKQAIVVSEQPISADLVLAKKEYILTGTLSGVCASIHTRTNSVVWSGTLDSPIFSNPTVYDDDRYVIFAEVSGDIHCRTVEKGIKIWRYSGAKGNIFSSIHIRPLGLNKFQMIFGCHDNHVYSLHVKTFQVSLQWKIPMGAAVYSTPCQLTNNLILAASNNGRMTVIDADNGDILSVYKLPKESFSSPAVYGDYIFIGCRNDFLYALKFVTNL